MTVHEQFNDEDSIMMREGVREIEVEMAEPILVLMWDGQTRPPDKFGNAPKPTFVSRDSYATIKQMDVYARYQAAGVMAAGDIILEMEDQLREATAWEGGTAPGDRVVFRGAHYRLVQRQVPVTVGDDVFYESHLRRTNEPADVADQ